MYLLIVLFLLTGNVTVSIGLVLLYNNYLWWSKGFQYDEMHLLINVATILVLGLYIMLHARVRRNEERKLQQLNIPEIY
tara:strand:- start:5106 stop:5342 length:237 start_codon:yes stop_codon:yes gene_type:complete